MRPKRLAVLSTVLVTFVFLAPALRAQEDDHKISVQASFEPAKVKPGEQVILKLAVTIEDGWHIYGRGGDPALSPPPTLKLGRTVLKPSGELQVPAGDMHDTGPWLLGDATLRQVFEVPAGAASGSLTLKGRVAYMACTEEFCNPPMELGFEAKLQVLGAGGQETKTKTVHQGDHVRIEAVLVPARAAAGAIVTLELRGQVADGYHVYGHKQDPKMGRVPRVEIAKGAAVEVVGDLELPPGKEHEWFGETYHFVEGSFIGRQRLRIPMGARPGRLAIPFHLDYQVCDDQACMDGQDDLVVELEVVGGAVVETGAPIDDNTPTNPLLDKNLLEIILLAVAAGLFALVMPCTYPMIPITVSYFTKQAETRDGRVLPLALTYGAGIVVIFVLVGVLVGEPIIKFAQNGWVNLALCVAFVYFALALFGIYELQPPRFLMNATSGAGSQGGYFGVFLMGAALVVATFACTFPVLGMLLALTATHEGAHYGLVALGMGVFGVTMAVPFVALSIIPGKLPRSGEWMNTAKIFFAFIELAMALKFFSNSDMVWGWQILPRERFLFLWSGIFLVTALYLFAQSLKHGLRKTALGRLILGIVILLLAIYFFYGGMGKPLHPFMSNFEPAYSRTDVPRHDVVYEDYDKAIAVAKAKKRKVLVNFTGLT